jgi:hypothetical protein
VDDRYDQIDDIPFVRYCKVWSFSYRWQYFLHKAFQWHMAFADLFNERGIEAFCEDNAANHMKEFRTVQYLRNDMSSL